MIAIIVGSAVYLTAMQASVNGPRAAFSDCLKQAGSQAASQKVAADAYSGFIRGQCAEQATAFKNALVSFDVKNGIARKQASDDADLQIDDYILGSTESYQARLPGNPPKTASAPAAPAPTPASSPK